VSLDEERGTIVRYWWKKAEESIASAQREIDHESLSFAMNRIYYAAFYAVSAALLERQIKFKKHSGVRSAFHREFVKSGKLDTDWGTFYDSLFEQRQEGDYFPLIEFNRSEVQAQLHKCQNLLSLIRPMISSIS
jgi:uncharacterized protein (UPF0332 family)